MKFRYGILFFLILACTHIEAQRKKKNKDTTPVITNEKSYDGFIPFTYDEKLDRITLKVDRLNEEFLYVGALSAGIGSNDIGLDRGQLGQEHVVKFIKAGNKLLLVEPNYNFRAVSDNPDEVKAVEEAFAQSVLWGFTIKKEQNGLYYIDATDFLIRDAHGVQRRLQDTKQGNYKLDKSRSAFNLDAIRNFPKNSEFDVILTFTGKADGNWIKSVAPSPDVVTIRQHHSFIELPDDQYQPRVFDPRAGYFGISYLDYATPIDQPIRKQFISRHRLEKKDPSAEISEAIEPIIYYLDRGAPEPIRSALLDGARWWNQAFEAIGYKNAFQVQLLPEGVDPLDVRYNVIQWVHRSTRGWSYGASIRDPRTGEIIKGHVSLGSLRVRQDFLIAQGLLSPYAGDNDGSAALTAMALARLRQLSAHEVGHTIGLAHSYASSTEGRASVMDYPHPLVEFDGQQISIDNAYDAKIGSWDKVAVAYGYQDFPDGTDEEASLESVIQKGLESGLTFLSDQDARPQSGAHPYAHLWDNGKSAHQELDRVMQIRRFALDKFGRDNIRSGMPYASLEEVLVPVYFFHRYQLESAVKLIGGINYRYAKKGDGQLIMEKVPSGDQISALKSILNSISPESLALPEDLLQLLPPRPLGYSRSNELIKIRTGLTFDALGASETASNMAFSLILNPARAQRLVEYNARDESQPGLAAVLDIMLNTTWKSSPKNGYLGAIQRTTNDVLLSNMFKLVSSKKASDQVKALATLKIVQLKNWLEIQVKTAKNEGLKAQYHYSIEKINRFMKNPDRYIQKDHLAPPAGSPIGYDFTYCSHQD